MTLLGLILAIGLLGAVLWLINTFLPPQLRTIFSVIAVVIVLIWLLQATGLFAGNFRIH
jgi:hypothetical protein